MALNTRWGSFNRLVTEELHTTYTREDIARGAGDADAFYFIYTRTRTKTYAYLGLTKAAAISCASALNRLYNRFTFKWVWDNDSVIWKTTSRADKYSTRINCGQAVPAHTAGDAWQVNVSVNEVISIPYRNMIQIERSDRPPLWTEFEANPDLRTNAFMGYTPTGTQVDFDYDEGAVGYGSL